MNNPKPWLLVGLTSGLYIMSMLQRSSTAVIALELTRDLALTPADLGLLGAAFFYASGLAQIPLGPALDRFGPRWTMILLNLLGTVGGLIFSLASGVELGLAGRILIGLGMAANLMGPLKWFTYHFQPHQFATLSGFMIAVGSLGSLLATSPLALLSGLLGWRGVLLVLSLINLLLTLGLVFWTTQPTAAADWAKPQAGDPARITVMASLRTLFTDPSYWSISLAAGLRYGAYAAIQTLWAGPFLIVHLGLSPVAAGNLLLLISLGFILGATPGGYLSDRVLKSRKKAGMISLILMSACVLALSLWPRAAPLWLLAVLMCALGLVAFSSQIMYTHIKDLMPPQMSGTAMTGINFFVFSGAGVFSHGLGGVLERGWGYQGAFLVCFGAMAAAAVAYGFSRDAKVGKG